MDTDKLILKFLWRDKRPRKASTILRNKVGEMVLPDFKTYKNSRNQKSVVLAKEWTTRSVEQTDVPDINPHKYSQLIFDKEPKATQ